MTILQYEFIERWNKALDHIESTKILTRDDMVVSVLEGERVLLWSLKGGTIKYRRVAFDNCCLTLRVDKRDVDNVLFEITLHHMTSKRCGPTTDHTVRSALPPDVYNCPAALFAKLIIVSANLTRQGKIAPHVSRTLLEFIQTVINQ